MTPAVLLKTIGHCQQKADEQAGELFNLWLEFGREVRAERKRQGIKLSAFASDMDVSCAMIGYLESGTRKWSLVMAKRAVKLLARVHG